MLRNPERSYVQRRLFSADHASNQLPGNQTEADGEPAMPLFCIGIETCSEYGSSTGRYQVRCNAARIGCVWDTQTTKHDGQLLADSGYTRHCNLFLASICFVVRTGTSSDWVVYLRPRRRRD